MSVPAQKLFESALALHRQGELGEAEKRYRAAIALDSGHSDAREWLGALLLKRNAIDEAIHWLREAAAQRPENAAFQNNLAAALAGAKRSHEAIAVYERSIAVAPDAHETRMALGNLLLQTGLPGRAMETYKQAIELDPQLQAACRDTRAILREEDRCHAILENCGHITARYPNYAPAHYGKACALLKLGRIAEARSASECALALDPTVPVYYHILIHTSGPGRNARAVAALEQLAASEHKLPDQDRCGLHFLLAKARFDDKRVADAFVSLHKANAIKRRMIAYDEGRELGRMRAAAETFTATRMRELRGAGMPGEIPVFVLGMPRSGTTLVEQILSSHSQVYGGGELTYLPDLISAAGMEPSFAAVSAAGLGRLGKDYIAKLTTIAPNARRIVDKLPYNFLHVGLIHLALSQARIIHVKRDPLETCFSCYSSTFAGDAGFAYDMAELGRYYRAYETLMAHWRHVLPDGAMLEVQYESLVDDISAEARRMIAYCGLAWEPQCLEFQHAARAVVTASLYQVRQPLYRTSIRRAGAYADHLEPLREALS